MVGLRIWRYSRAGQFAVCYRKAWVSAGCAPRNLHRLHRRRRRAHCDNVKSRDNKLTVTNKRWCFFVRLSFTQDPSSDGDNDGDRDEHEEEEEEEENQRDEELPLNYVYK